MPIKCKLYCQLVLSPRDYVSIVATSHRQQPSINPILALSFLSHVPSIIKVHCFIQWGTAFTWSIILEILRTGTPKLAQEGYPDCKVNGAYMGPTWVLSAPDGPHVGPMNLAFRVGMSWLLRVSCLIYDLHLSLHCCPDSKVHVANMGPIWGQQDLGGPHVGPMNLAIWVYSKSCCVGSHPNGNRL